MIDEKIVNAPDMPSPRSQRPSFVQQGYNHGGGGAGPQYGGVGGYGNVPYGMGEHRRALPLTRSPPQARWSPA